jgi:cell wall-associated NlpC family hydrolase
MPDSASMSRTGGRTARRFLAATISVAAVLAVGAPAFAGSPPSAPATPAGAAPTTTTTLPAIPKVNPDITDGQNPQTLLSNAIALSSVGIDTSALATATAATQAKMDADASAAEKADRVAFAAQAMAQAALKAAAAAASTFDSTNAAVTGAVVDLYVEGPASLSVNPDAGGALLYAAAYAQSTLGPYGILASRFQAQKDQAAALKQAKAAFKKADAAAKKAEAALKAEQSEAARLQTELASISKATAAEVAADHLALAQQAGAELLSASSLQFNPKTPIPPPVSTTPIALTWAFAELGKPYQWGATGPNTFDCSGLTQFVWRAAGVSIPRVAADQDAWTIPVPLSQILPGDLVFFGKTDIHHVGIYIGDGLMINAPHTGTVVQVSSIWWSDLAGFGRVHAPGTPIPPHQPPTVSQPAQPVVIAARPPVPSQPKPPPGWKPAPGETTPVVVVGGGSSSPAAPTTTTTTTTTTVAPSTTTTVPPSTTTNTTSTTSTSVPAGG